MVPSISPDVVIMTRSELAKLTNAAFLRGVERGRFEESCDRSNSAPPGQVGHLAGAVDSHEPPIPDRTAAPTIPVE